MTSLGLSMIVRDGAEWLSECLASARPVVSEIVIADTGSTDSSIQIAKSLGARVVSIDWTNDFAAARNRALAEMTTDWVLSLDADELLDSGAASRIPALLAKTRASGFQVTIRNYVLSLQDRIWDRPAVANSSPIPQAAKYLAYVEHENVRLFRRDSDVTFVGRVHESVGPCLLKLGRRIEPAPFFIHHFGLAVSEEIRERKNGFYRELGREKIRERPTDAQAHLELGLVEMDNFGNLDEAARLFRRACELNPKFGVAWFFLGITALRKNRFSEALKHFAKAEGAGHRTALVAESKGDAHYNCGDFLAAIRCYELALSREPISPVLESKLGLAKVRSGNAEEGLKHLHQARQSRPAASELHDRLLLALVALNRLPEAAQAAEGKLASISAPSARDFLRAASIWSKAGDPARAAAMLQVGLQMHAGNNELTVALAELRKNTSAEIRRIGIIRSSTLLHE